jgi:hypothetical protein
MVRLVLELPDALMTAARRAAEEEGVALEDLLATALAEKLSHIGAAQVAEHGLGCDDLRRYRAILAKVPDTEPEPGDELPRG